MTAGCVDLSSSTHVHIGCTWKAVFLGDLMAPDRVKFHYRKAMLVLHPDKNVNGSLEQRFVAERVRSRQRRRR